MRLTIRSKVVLLSLTLLTIPYFGYEYISKMESHLRNNLENSLSEMARTYASILNERTTLFQRDLIETLSEDNLIFIQPLNTQIQLDGSPAEWQEYLAQTPRYASQHILKQQGSYSETDFSFQYILGKYEQNLYALFWVTDDQLVYRSSRTLRLDQSDHLQIVWQTATQPLGRYIITASNHGWVNAYKVNSFTGDLTGTIEPNIHGTWAEVENGYILEIRFFNNLSKDRQNFIIGNQLGFAIADVDNNETKTIDTLIGTSAFLSNTDELGNPVLSSPEAEQIMSALGTSEGRRIWVLDRHYRVLSRTGNLRQDIKPHPLNKLYALFLSPASESLQAVQAGDSTIRGEEVNLALQGQPAVRWRATEERQGVIVSSAHPIYVDEEVVGTVVVQETSNSIQSIHRQAIDSLVQQTIVFFSIVTLLLVLFANHLSLRLRSLRNQADTAIDKDGRIHIAHIRCSSEDEIGDLARSFSTMLEKLQQYNNYLETVASRLSHELRTPIAVVRSSLENLEQETLPPESQVYIERAKTGIQRLNTIITRLSEATRLEQALQQAEKESFDLVEVVSSCVSGYRLIYPTASFRADILHSPLILEGSPDLIAQMLDKLIANAVDFSDSIQPIHILLTRQKNLAYLEISNYGATLPNVMQAQLFDSMVSLRAKNSQKNAPHLGLGLYIVRLIVNYHGGNVKAQNHETGNGVVLSITLPLKLEAQLPALMLLSTAFFALSAIIKIYGFPLIL